GEEDGRGIVALRARPLLGEMLFLSRPLAVSEALVAELHRLDDLVGRHAVALRLRQRGRPGNASRDRGADESDTAGHGRGSQECSPIDTLGLHHVVPPLVVAADPATTTSCLKWDVGLKRRVSAELSAGVSRAARRSRRPAAAYRPRSR